VISIARTAVDALLAHAREAVPLECCGLLLGGDGGIDAVHRARNLHASATRFLIDPADHFAAIRAARASGRRVVGVYHSHPATEAAPSRTDLAEASYPEYVYVIASPNGPSVRAFKLEAGGFVEIALRVMPDRQP
jgi:proteasome lid subunit RPN8/RPN11